MKLRLRRPRDLALALRDLARRRPDEAEDYLDAHAEEWESLAEAEPHNAADILEALDESAAADLLAELDLPEAAEVLEEMRTEAAVEILEEIDAGSAARLIEALPRDEAADIVAELDEDLRAEVLAAISDEAESDVRALLAYAPDSAGGLMRTDVVSLPIGLGAGEAIEALRRLHATLPGFSYVYVTDDDLTLRGVISFRDLVFARPGTGVDEVMVPNPVALRPETDREEVAELIQRYNLLGLPVVDAAGKLLGMVGVEDALEAVQQEATEDIAAMVGAGMGETPYTPVGRSVRGRLPWIVMNLATAFLVAYVISQFEDTIETLAVLAAFMPVVASVGGNGGSQSLAVMVRALAVEDLPRHVARRAIVRELGVGVVNGSVIAVLAGAIATVTTGQLDIGFVIGLAAVGNMTIAGLAGASIPILLQKAGQDPALASHIFLTMITDLLGFGGFLAIATLLL